MALDVMTVERPEQLKALGHPLRLRVLEMLGQEVGCSPFYLSRIFSREVGLTIPQFLRNARMERAAELLRIAPEDAGDPAQAEGCDVGANERPRLGDLVDEQCKSCAARERLEPERAGSGEQIEHAGAADRILVAVDQDVE